MLAFVEGAAPTQSFRLVIAGTAFSLLCETLQRDGRKLRVRFVNVADAEALSRYVLSLPEQPSACVPLATARPAAFSVRDLRRSVLGIGAAEPVKAGEAA